MPRPLRLAAMIEAMRDERTVPSLLCSLALHAAVILLGLVLLTWFKPPTLPPRPFMVVADLVPLAESTVSPDAPDRGPIPQQAAPESTGSPEATGAPEPNDRRPAAARSHAERAPAKSAESRNGEASSQRPPSRGEDRTAAGGDLTARLEAFAKLKVPPSQLPPDPRPQEGTGTSNRTVASNAARGSVAAYGVKDFVRAQIARRWYIDRASKPYAMAQAQQWVARLNLRLNPDGTVADAAVSIPAGMRDNDAFGTFAQSVRNAALLSSPLELLPGTYEAVKDVELEFPISSLPP